MLVIKAGIRKMFVRMSDLGLHCFLSHFCRQLLFEILEHLTYLCNSVELFCNYTQHQKLSITANSMPPGKSVFVLKINFLISQLRIMIWVFKRPVSLRRFF